MVGTHKSSTISSPPATHLDGSPFFLFFLSIAPEADRADVLLGGRKGRGGVCAGEVSPTAPGARAKGGGRRAGEGRSSPAVDHLDAPPFCLFFLSVAPEADRADVLLGGRKGRGGGCSWGR